MLRYIVAKLDDMEMNQRRGAHLDDVRDDEAVAPNPNPKPEEDQDEDILLKVLELFRINERRGEAIIQGLDVQLKFFTA